MLAPGACDKQYCLHTVPGEGFAPDAGSGVIRAVVELFPFLLGGRRVFRHSQAV